MVWSLVALSTALWVFHAEYFVKEQQFREFQSCGVPIPDQTIKHISLLRKATATNLVVFLVIYGVKVSWVTSIFIVVGGYVTSLAMIAVAAYAQMHGTMLFRLGWVGIPVFAIAMWLLAFQST